MLTEAKQEKVKLEKVEKEEKRKGRERKKRQEKKQDEGQVDSKWEKHATAEMGIGYGEITDNVRQEQGWEEEGKYSPVYYFL